MPKLLFLVTEDWYFVSHRLALAKQAQAEGYDVVIATRMRDAVQPMTELGLRVVSLELSRRGTHPLTLWREILKVRKLYQTEKPDIVHHVALKPVIIGGLAARSLKLRHVVSAIAGMGFLFTESQRAQTTRKTLEWILPKAIGQGIAIVQNTDDQNGLKRMAVNPDKIHLIAGAGVDINHFTVLPEPEGTPIVMLASRLLWDKGIAEFVEASRLAKASGLNARFVLVGTPDPDNPAGVDQDSLTQWIDNKDIEWWGHRRDMAATLSQATIVCLPSYREGMPKVLLEAMSCGRACITTDVPGCREAVTHEDNGLLVPAKDSKALAQAITQLLSNPNLRQQMAKRGRERAENEFSQDRVNRQTIDLYKELLQ
ncbi:glycosyltransferase family 4 protein [Orrella sp. 11846]|uniref:glycosyltransferase family 4 protein n=1 Tax=Orrella sp. 11846 TaxID=3409913 RepID=UPI003B59685A